MERDQALNFMHDLLRLMVSKKGSDLFITAGFPPAIKVDGRLTPVSNQTLSAQHTAELARAIMNDRQAAEFEAHKECNFAIAPAGIGRFRVNAFVQMGRIGVVCRTINTTIPTLEALGLPPVLKDVAMVGFQSGRGARYNGKNGENGKRAVGLDKPQKGLSTARKTTAKRISTGSSLNQRNQRWLRRLAPVAKSVNRRPQ